MDEISALTRRRILITRTPGRASELATLLQNDGAVIISIPTIEIVPLESFMALDEALAHLDDFDWVVFTSVHAVEVFGERRKSESVPKQIAVIGPGTARAVEEIGMRVSLLPPRYVAESLAESLAPYARGARILLIRAAEARDVLPTTLLRAGTRLTVVDAYRNRIPEESIPRLRELFGSPVDYPDVITFTSASTARNLKTLLDAAGMALPIGIALASIGPITSQAIRDLGREPTVEADESTIPALAQAIVRYFGRRST